MNWPTCANWPGADVKEVAAGMGYDARSVITSSTPGLGWGGSCFPKDVKALAFMAKERNSSRGILNAVMNVNYDRRSDVVKHIGKMVGGLKGKTIGLFGLAFKPEHG